MCRTALCTCECMNACVSVHVRVCEYMECNVNVCEGDTKCLG